MKTAINAVIIDDGRVLLVKKKESWILPGGKIDFNESDEECLRRETKEELSGTELKDIIFYKEFEGITPHTKEIIKAKVYFAKINGKLNNASAEILEHKWVSCSEFAKHNISDITLQVLNWLSAEGRI